MFNENDRAPYSPILLEPRRVLPNLMICVNASSAQQLDRRFFLPLVHAADFFSTRNITLLGDNPLAHPDFEFLLTLFSRRRENLAVWLKPGQSCGHEKVLSFYTDEVVFFLGPYSGPAGEWLSLLESLRAELETLRVARPDLPVRAVFYLTADTLLKFSEIIGCCEKARFDRLEFFTDNLFIKMDGARSPLPLNPRLLPSLDTLQELEDQLWEILDEKFFQSFLFDLDMTRRQLERVLLYYKAAWGKELFAPPHCRASRTAFYIEPSGLVRCCPYQAILGELRKESLREIEESPVVHDFRAKINLTEEKVCLVCPGDFPHFLWRGH